jgi:hypothetical protein
LSGADVPIRGAGLEPLRFALDEAQHFEVRVGETLLGALVGPSGVLARPCGLLTLTFPSPPNVFTAVGEVLGEHDAAESRKATTSVTRLAAVAVRSSCRGCVTKARWA